MTPIYEDPHFTFRFADDRVIPRFHLEGIEAGRQVSVIKINPDTSERLGLLATATVGDGGWVDLQVPIIVKAGEAFIAVPKPGRSKLVNAILRRKWHDLLGAWVVTPSVADETFEDIRQHYTGPGRFYHTLDHVGAMLETVESLAAFARNLNAVKLGVWLHDMIYDSRASDNEARSAECAEQLCEKASIPEGRVVAPLILKTKTHEAGDDPDAQVLIDADLAILGASELAYRTYADQIRQEYAWVLEPDYRKGRRQVLERFMARPTIFHLLVRLEALARRNISAEIARLQEA